MTTSITLLCRRGKEVEGIKLPYAMLKGYFLKHLSQIHAFMDICVVFLLEIISDFLFQEHILLVLLVRSLYTWIMSIMSSALTQFIYLDSVISIITLKTAKRGGGSSI